MKARQSDKVFTESKVFVPDERVEVFRVEKSIDQRFGDVLNRLTNNTAIMSDEYGCGKIDKGRERGGGGKREGRREGGRGGGGIGRKREREMKD